LLTRSFSYSALRTYMHIPTKKLLTPYFMSTMKPVARLKKFPTRLQRTIAISRPHTPNQYSLITTRLA
jgi:hypothetical protein